MIRKTAISGMIAALYAALTVALSPLSFGPVQFRVAEALTLLPFFMPEAIPGLFIGCFLSNIAGGFGLIDIVRMARPIGASDLAIVFRARVLVLD